MNQHNSVENCTKTTALVVATKDELNIPRQNGDKQTMGANSMATINSVKLTG